MWYFQPYYPRHYDLIDTFLVTTLSLLESSYVTIAHVAFSSRVVSLEDNNEFFISFQRFEINSSRPVIQPKKTDFRHKNFGNFPPKSCHSCHAYRQLNNVIQHAQSVNHAHWSLHPFSINCHGATTRKSD